jgi:hypothetical protein
VRGASAEARLARTSTHRHTEEVPLEHTKEHAADSAHDELRMAEGVCVSVCVATASVVVIVVRVCSESERTRAMGERGPERRDAERVCKRARRSSSLAVSAGTSGTGATRYSVVHQCGAHEQAQAQPTRAPSS